MKVYVNYDDARWKKYKIDFARIARAAAHAAGANRAATVSITLVDDEHIHELNRQYRNIDRPTNVLSFELGDDVLLGDIFISLDTVARQAADAGISVAEHTAHMVVHGVLHLMGYDHIKDDDAAVMESMEIEILAKLGIANPYADAPHAAVRPMRGVFMCVLSALCGVVSAAGFAPFHIWGATLVGIAAAYWMITRARRARTAYTRAAAFGAGYAVAMFGWAVSSIYVVPELARQFAIWTVPGILGIAAAGAVVFAWPFVAARMVARAARPFMFAGVWTLILWAREWMFTGFPWNPISNIAINIPTVANSMSVWGALGLTFIITGLIAATVEIVAGKKRAMCIVSGAFFVLMLGISVPIGAKNIAVSNAGTNENSPLIRIVQPAAAQNQKMSYSHDDAVRRAEENVRDLIALGQSAGDGGVPDLIVYPETTYPYAVMTTDADFPFSKILGTNVVIGAQYVDIRSRDIFNSMIFSDADGNIVDVYSKSHLVPFGEYSPLGIMPSPAHMTPGAGPSVISMTAGGDVFTFAPAVCYEIIFSDSLIPRGADVSAIINVTNDTWFGRTPGTYQHLDMVRRYAIESGLPIVRANYSGISAFIAPDGEIVAMLPIGARGVIDGRVGAGHVTPYRAIGRDGWMIIILMVACAGVIAMRRRD